MRAELELVVSFAERASALGHDSKALRLSKHCDSYRSEDHRIGSGKAVIFTESLTTQNYLRRLLVDQGYQPNDVTLFRGDTRGPMQSAR